MQYNRYGRQVQRWIQRRTSTVVDMRDNRDGYGNGVDVVWQHMRCGTKEMEKWVERTATDWENINRERLPT